MRRKIRLPAGCVKYEGRKVVSQFEFSKSGATGERTPVPIQGASRAGLLVSSIAVRNCAGRRQRTYGRSSLRGIHSFPAISAFAKIQTETLADAPFRLGKDQSA